MFEFIIAALISWPALVVFVLLAVFSEYHDSSWAIFFGIVIAIVSYFYFGVRLKDLLIGIPVYGLIGVIWSFWRYKRHVTKRVDKERDRDGQIDAQTQSHLRAELAPSRMLGTIVSWIIIWPISLVENLLGDVITGVELLVTNVFKSIYRRIYESAMSDMGKSK